MVRIQLKHLSDYNKLRFDPLNLCPPRSTKLALCYDYAFHKQVMELVNGGKVPRLSRLMKKGQSLEDVD